MESRSVQGLAPSLVRGSCKTVPLLEIWLSPLVSIFLLFLPGDMLYLQVLQRKLKECVPQESRWHEQLLAEIKRPQTLQPSTARESGARPKEMPVMPKIALRPPSDCFLTFQDASTEFKTVNAIAQQLEPEVQVRV